jgi:hypothetical protein
MVLDVSSLVPSALKAGGTGLSVVWYIVLGAVVLILLGIIAAIFYFKKRWNLQVEFKLTRSDGRLTNAEWGKGYYDAKKGVVNIKRPGTGWLSSGIPIKIFDIRRYMQGDSIITVIQVGPEDFRPVLNDSWTEHVSTYKDSTTGKIQEVKESILNIKVDSGLNKAWKSAWDSAAKNAYSIRSFLSQFQTPIAIGIVIICCFVGFAILWTKVH